jgi:hypothetical protein
VLTVPCLASIAQHNLRSAQAPHSQLLLLKTHLHVYVRPIEHTREVVLAHQSRISLASLASRLSVGVTSATLVVLHFLLSASFTQQDEPEAAAAVVSCAAA